MPSKADFSIRRLISQKKQEDEGEFLSFNSSSPTQNPHAWIQAQSRQLQPIAQKPSLFGRRASVDPLVIHETRTGRPIVNPLPSPPLSSSGSPPRSRNSRDGFARLSQTQSMRTLTPSPTPDYAGHQRSLTTYPTDRLRPTSPFRRSTSPAHSFRLSDDQGYMAGGREMIEIPRKPVGSPSPTPVPLRSSSALSIVEKDDSLKKRTTKTTVPARTGSVSKNKGRKNSNNRKSKQPRSKKSARGSARWTFTENVTELFTGQLFKKIEADEMLTPEQVEAYTRRREAEAEMIERQDTEALEARSILEEEEEPESPMEPFHLEELAKRIEHVAAAASHQRESPLNKRQVSNEVVRRDFSVRRKPVGSAGQAVSSLATEEPPAPSVPAKNPARYRNNTQTQAQMPAIPELLVTTPDNEKEKEALKDPIHGNTPTKETLDNLFEDDDFVFFRSTPCTMSMPGFRHGPIRIAKSGLDFKFDAENTLDWTAFQMAILGGAGDFFYGSADPTPQHSEEEEVAELKEWLGELGFDSIGALISAQGVEPPEDSDESSANSPISTSSSCYEEEDEDDEDDCGNLPIPVALDYPTGFWNEGEPDTSKFSVGGGCQIKRWTVEGHPKRYKRGSYASDISLPQSPMMPLVVDGKLTGEMRSTTAAKGDMDVIPMGYNLGHDLGDFLRWEAEHCYAPDLQGRT
ncbi:hypothetical protein jhhlp_000915 [Lomentospora prolificans]|uniref:Uncharacterized protein n=1 Tax=Lomentospora prolificans TaxID=41688 RepID=A0A2N3NJU7_9PEZI|nr:hypothetical protein jhhlp_000915 [Lomentospora prolificans]